MIWAWCPLASAIFTSVISASVSSIFARIQLARDLALSEDGPTRRGYDLVEEWNEGRVRALVELVRLGKQDKELYPSLRAALMLIR